MPSKDDILKRADDLLAKAAGASLRDTALINEVHQGALTLLRVVHGPGSVHETQLVQAMTAADKAKDGNRMYNIHAYVAPAAVGALKSLKADVEAGLGGSIVMRGSGEVLGDLLGLAREALATGGDPQKNVAAVLVAAAFEDTLRRLAENKAGVNGRPKLEEVIGALKSAGVLVGAAVSTANGYLKFRNDSLHADWQNVQPPVIGSCMVFVEGLLQQHFS